MCPLVPPSLSLLSDILIVIVVPQSVLSPSVSPLSSDHFPPISQEYAGPAGGRKTRMLAVSILVLLAILLTFDETQSPVKFCSAAVRKCDER